MVFKRMLAGLGAGGASVETTLNNPSTYPGQAISGTVTVNGGNVPQDVLGVTVGLAARVEIERNDYETNAILDFSRFHVAGRFTIAPGSTTQFPFSIPVPWEAPITVLNDRALHGMFVGVHTDLDIARGADKGDLDQIHIHPLPAQQRVLDGLTRLGWQIKSADLERGRLQGSQMPFYQEIEYFPPSDFRRHMNELEVTFLAGPHAMDVVLEADNRGGLFTEGRDQYTRFTVSYADVDRINWDSELHGALSRLASRRGWF